MSAGTGRVALVTGGARRRGAARPHTPPVLPRTPAGEVSEREWDGIFAVNLRGPFLLTQALLPLLRAKQGGDVIFLGDAGAGHLWPGCLPYCLSKLALAPHAAAG